MRRLAVGLTIAAVLWVAVLLAAPYGLRTTTISVPSAILYTAAARICHQRVERSFHLGGIQLPVCARCFGLYGAGALGALAAWASRRRSSRTARVALGIAAVPTALTWGAEAAGLAGFSNMTRAAAALPLGAAAGWWFVQMLRYDSQLNAHEIYDGGARAHGS